MFKTFELENQPLINDFPVFQESEKKSFLSLDIKPGQILNDITMAINRTRKEIMIIKETKETKLKNMLDMFDSTLSDLKRFKTSGAPILEAIKTMRKLPEFGLQNEKINFEWPKKEDLLVMPEDKPIKIEKLIYQMDAGSLGIYSIQVVLSNG